MLNIRTALLAAALTSLGGCATPGPNGELPATCLGIYSAFATIDNNQPMVSIVKNLAASYNYNIDDLTPANAKVHYQTMRDTANLTLMASGCKPLKQ